MKNIEFMQKAFKEAKKAYQKKEIPVGAVIVKDNKIISCARNNRQRKYNVLGHAEINAIIKAEKKLHDWRLDECVMYVTLEPCSLCSKIIDESRIDKVFYLIDNKEQLENKKNFIKTNVCGTLKDEYQNLLENFFENLRNK